jgi:hypothetical protein
MALIVGGVGMADTIKMIEKKELEAHKPIQVSLDNWMKDFADERSTANLYGWSMVDAIYLIHKRLNERGL